MCVHFFFFFFFFLSPASVESPYDDRIYCLCTVRRSRKGMPQAVKSIRLRNRVCGLIMQNDLPAEVKDAPSVAAFRSRLNKDLNKPPSYYNTGTRIGQILQARLRLGCSSLNADLYRKNSVPNPTCACGGFESAYHFLFVCPRLAHFQRRYFSGSLLNFTVKDFLYGSQNLTFQENEQIFLKVQEYIVKSRRFL